LGLIQASTNLLAKELMVSITKRKPLWMGLLSLELLTVEGVNRLLPISQIRKS